MERIQGTCFVIDNGSSTLRVGLTDEEYPRFIFSNVIGRRTHGSVVESYIGNEAQDKRELLSLTYPMQNGVIFNWDDMEKIWDYSFYEKLKLPPEEHPIIFTDAPLNPKSHREKLTQVIFEKYDTPAFYIGAEPVLSVQVALARETVVVVNIGHTYTFVASGCHYYLCYESLVRYDFGGRDMTNYLQHLLLKRGFCFTTNSELEILKEVKEKFCAVFTQRGGPTPSSKPGGLKQYELPDGSLLTLGKECYTCPEIMFQPDGLFNQSRDGLAEMVHKSIQACDPSCHKKLYRNIMLCGGSTYFPGLAERLKVEVEETGPWTASRAPSVQVITDADRHLYAWIGAAILASTCYQDEAWISKQEYQEYGPTIVHRKCII